MAGASPAGYLCMAVRPMQRTAPPTARQVGLDTGRSGRTPGIGAAQLRDGLNRFSFLLGGSDGGGRLFGP